MIHLTPTAVQEIHRLRAKHQQLQALFRLKIVPGGCADFLYTMTFDEQIDPEDQIYACDDVQVVIDAISLNYAEGLTIDYSEDLMGGGFRFRNPKAIQHCGCGNSFSVGDVATAPLL